MSDLLDDILSKESGRFDQKDGDEDDKGDAVAILAAAGQVSHHHDFNKSENDCSEHGSSDVADATEDCRDERLDAGHESHQRVGAAVFDPPEDSRDRGK